MDTDVFAVGATVLTLTLIKKLMDLARFGAGAIRGDPGALGSFISQVAVYVISIFTVWLIAGGAFAEGWVVGPVVVSTANFATLVTIGLLFGSAASVGWDYLKARDNTQTAAVPPLVKNA